MPGQDHLYLHDLETLEADVNGASGQEQAEYARQWALANGYTLEDDTAGEMMEQIDQTAEDQWLDEYLLREQRLESELGRELTTDEKEMMFEDAGTSNTIPDLRETYDRVVERLSTDDEYRKDAMVKDMQEHDPDTWDPKHKASPEPRNPDEERQAAMLGDMKESE